MSKIKTEIDLFVKSLVDSEKELLKFSNIISDLEQNIENEVSGLDKFVIDRVDNSNSKASGDSDIRLAFENSSEILKSTVERFKNDIEETKKGMKFIEDFEKHFIVTVFGKVKAGKSYLGNFIMGNSIRRADVETGYSSLSRPEVQVYDRGKLHTQDKLNELEDTETKDFKVKSTEATSTIQWFFLGGMAWFDTPGIGSITAENEELAKEYVKNSDLIVFAINADAAGTRQEFEEIKELQGMDKPVVLLITMSDTFEEDIDENDEIVKKLVAKSDRDRRDVENYMLETLKENGAEDVLKHSEIITISTRLANEGVLNKDEESFESSNIGKFYRKLASITDEKAIDFKKANPKKRINKLIDDIVKGTQDKQGILRLEANLNEILENTKNKKREISKLSGIVIDRLKSEANISISDYISEIKSNLEDRGIETPASNIKDNVSKIISNKFRDIAGEELGRFLDGFDKQNYSISVPKDMNILAVKKKQEKISYEFTEVYRESRDPDGFLEKIGDFFGKEYYRTRRNTVTKEKVIDVGVNDQEVMRSIMNQFDSIYRREIDKKIEDISNDYFGNLEKLLVDTISELNMTKSRLDAMKL